MNPLSLLSIRPGVERSYAISDVESDYAISDKKNAFVYPPQDGKLVNPTEHIDRVIAFESEMPPTESTEELWKAFEHR
jgi:hypothetical protein